MSKRPFLLESDPNGPRRKKNDNKAIATVTQADIKYIHPHPECRGREVNQSWPEKSKCRPPKSHIASSEIQKVQMEKASAVLQSHILLHLKYRKCKWKDRNESLFRKGRGGCCCCLCLLVFFPSLR